ncbi:hypothetical protein AOLI_G00152050 [Acnodon oligacanthus]
MNHEVGNAALSFNKVNKLAARSMRNQSRTYCCWRFGQEALAPLHTPGARHTARESSSAGGERTLGSDQTERGGVVGGDGDETVGTKHSPRDCGTWKTDRFVTEHGSSKPD